MSIYVIEKNGFRIDMIDQSDLDKIICDPEALLIESQMAAAIWCGKIDGAHSHADQVAKNKGKYYQQLYYFLDKYS
tara:strand:- start:1265 stop:1492 length:228 start_codon:yes stop_codon:yes gene_type:complete